MGAGLSIGGIGLLNAGCAVPTGSKSVQSYESTSVSDGNQLFKDGYDGHVDI